MAYELTIACGVALAAVLVGRYMTRGAESLIARLVRRALLFLGPLFLVALMFSLHHYWLGTTADIVRTSTTIGQLEGVIGDIQFPAVLHAAFQGQNTLALVVVLAILAALLIVRPGTPHLGIGKWVASGVGVVYALATMIVSGAFLGHAAVRDIDARVERLEAQVADIERKTTVYKTEVEDAAREIVKEALIGAVGVASIQTQLDAVRASLRAAQEEIEPYRYLFRSVERPFGGDSLESDFTGTWRDIRNTITEMHWGHTPPRATIPDVGRSGWSTLRLYEASTDLRNYKLARPKEAPSELHDTIAKTFDVVYAAAGKPDLAATLEINPGYPLAPLVVSLVDVWYEPLQALAATQAETLFHATVVERQPFADVAAAALAQAREAIIPLKAELQPGLERVARGLQRLEGEAERLPQSFRRFAERTYPERLQTFRSNWHRVLSFSAPAAARAATALREQTESLLETPADPFQKHERLNAYEQTLQTVAGRVDDTSRYQALLRFEQQLFDGQPGSRAFARFTKEHVESRLAAENGGLAEEETLTALEIRSQWLETHRLAAAGLLDDADTTWEPGDRERILRHLALDLQFFTRAIRERYKPETYTTDELRTRIRRYSKLASALEPDDPQGGEFVDTISGNLTGRSARGALRFEIVYLVARAEARLRLSPSEASLRLADILRQERDGIAVYQNGSEDSYVKAVSDLWQEADLQPELGAEVSETVVNAIQDDSERLKVPAVGAVRALRRLVQQSKDKAQEVTRLRRELAALETPDAALNRALASSHAQFLWLQDQIRRDWAKTRRQLHINAAYRSR